VEARYYAAITTATATKHPSAGMGFIVMGSWNTAIYPHCMHACDSPPFHPGQVLRHATPVATLEGLRERVKMIVKDSYCVYARREFVGYKWLTSHRANTIAMRSQTADFEDDGCVYQPVFCCMAEAPKV
jgi:hypothetical protein